jgi:Macrocin-O-methyltransferase (TylF)
MTKPHESSVVSYSPPEALGARSELFGLMHGYQATAEEKERSLGLFLRGSLLARLLAIADLYQRIVEVPGMIFDVGTWRGQTAVVCENLRAIYEPLHFNRRIACFDTFEGYVGFSNRDKATALHQDGTYGVGGQSYAEYLSQLLQVHERNNAMGHNHGKHRVIAGDCRETIPKFFKDNPHEFVALAFFDVNSYEPTAQAFEAVWQKLAPGGIAAFWQLTRATIPAEGRVFTEQILNKVPHALHRAPTYPGLCFLVKS